MAKPFDVDKIFTYHRPFGNQPERYESIRESARNVANLLQSSCPPSRELSTALTHLQTAMMYANAAIAINEVEPVAEAQEAVTA